MRRWPLPASSRATQAKVDFSVFFSGCNAFPRATRTRAFPPMYRWPASGILTHATQAKAGFSIFWGDIPLSPRVTQTRAFPPMYRWPPPASFRTPTQEGQASPSFKDVTTFLRVTRTRGFPPMERWPLPAFSPRVMRTKATAACLCAQKAHRLSVSARAKGGAKRPASIFQHLRAG